VLEEALLEFQEIHPNAKVATVALPKDQLLSAFIDAGNDGLGPGLLIADDAWIGDLVDAQLIRSISPDENLSRLFDSRTSALVQHQDQIFGIPLSLAPVALYYNEALVDELPEDLDDLLRQAAAGKAVGFVPRFEQAYWGIQAFGEGLFDADGQFTPAESGFLDWLQWLNAAQSEPGIILSVDDRSLRELFASGELGYYIAGPQELANIEALAEDENALAFAVAPLPQGPTGQAGPLLHAETVILYAHDSPQQAQIAEALARFLVNQQQSIRFMRELEHVPANPVIRVDQRIYPRVNGFAQQAQSAVVIPNEIPTETLFAAGDLAYASVLSGLSTPAEALCRFSRDVAVSLGPEAVDVRLPDGCEP
jgi:maltose-binding protein MalE